MKKSLTQCLRAQYTDGRAEQSRAEQSRAEQSRAVIFSGLSVLYAQFDIQRPISDTGYSRAGNGSFYNF